ncbi:MAG TPA: DEAD/DEAH box helicase [Pirellulales bacterium]|nr:DEAD/DEAH box helicase [Pirellulales bacterium]
MHGTQSLAQRCRSSFSSSAWNAGEEYYRGRRVAILEVEREGLSADVFDRSGAGYEVNLEWSSPADKYIEAICTCSLAATGKLCKHVAAVIHAIDRDTRVQHWPGTDNLLVLPAEEFYEAPPPLIGRKELSELLGPAKAQALLAALDFTGTSAPRRKPAAVPRKAQHSWRKALKELAVPAGAEDDWGSQPLSSAEAPRVFYRIDLAGQGLRDRLQIEFIRRAVKRNGELGVPARWPLDADDADSMADPADRELLALLLGGTPQNDSYSYHYYHSSSRKSATCLLLPATYGLLLPRLAATGRFGWIPGIDPRQEELNVLRWDDGPPWQFKLSLSAPVGKAGRTLKPRLYRDGEEADLTQVVLVLPGVVLFRDRLGRLDASVASRSVDAARRLSETVVPPGQEDQFVEEICKNSGLPAIELPDDLRWEQLNPEPQPRVTIGPTKLGTLNLLFGKLAFDYAGQVVESEDGRRFVCDASQRRIVHRKRDREEAARSELYSLGATPASVSENYYGSFKVARKDFAALVLALHEKGWHVEAEGHRIRRPGTTHISLSSGVDWFELEGHVEYEGEQVGLPKLLEALQRGEGFVTLGDGSRGMLPEEWLSRYMPLAAMGEADGAKLLFKPSQALLLDAWLSARPEVDVDAAFAQVRERLRSFEGVRPLEEPAGFSGTLRPYQRDGVGWLLFLQEFGFGGCLADDMGLGKTIQVLAMIADRRGRRSDPTDKRPSLVVVPRSLVQNWIDEACRFTPNLKVLDYTGLSRCAAREKLDQYDLVVTTYGTLRRDAGYLKDLQFDYAILDEAQAIKNSASQAAKACRLLTAPHRLAMTGTPVENHLGELWSIFEFLNPGMLGRSNNLRFFSKDSTADAENVQLLAKALRPFILRRTKEQVLSELPEKTEQTLYCELEPRQRKLYDELRNHYRDALGKRIAKDGMNKAKIHVLEALLRLRQAACHPGLLDKAKAAQPSAKLETLLVQLDEVLQEGHKALVFSQFTSLLALVRKQLDKRKIAYEYLDGSTRDRAARVERFQTDAACPLFLISLKAGGLGLNLTAADYVFILDPWWNPAVEAQAIDRAHRIGQTHRVFAYRLIARDTVEEKILELQRDKRKLADAIVSAENSLIGQLTADDLRLLLS